MRKQERTGSSLVHKWTDIINYFQNKIELIGRFQMQPVVRDTQIYNYAPKLQWYEFNKGENQMGQLLMSAQLIVVGIDIHYLHNLCTSMCGFYKMQIIPMFLETIGTNK